MIKSGAGRPGIAAVVTIICQIAYMGSINMALRFVELVPLQYIVLAVVAIGASWQMRRNGARRRLATARPSAAAAAGT